MLPFRRHEAPALCRRSLTVACSDLHERAIPDPVEEMLVSMRILLPPAESASRRCRVSTIHQGARCEWAHCSRSADNPVERLSEQPRRGPDLECTLTLLQGELL